MSTELKDRKTYVSVEEACSLCNRSERTVRRWVEKGYVRVKRDEQTRSVYIDLDDIRRMQAMKPDTIHPVQDEIKRIASNEEDREQRIQKLENLVTMLLERQEVLEKRVDALVSQQRAGTGSLILLPRRTSRTSGAESRGLPAGTLRLVPFAAQHKANLSEIKALHIQHVIELTIHQREGEIKRNKQEWWITPEQQVQLIRYWQEHQIPYTSCSQCQGCIEQMQNSEIS